MPLLKKKLSENSYALLPKCEVCSNSASYGLGVDLINGKPGLWYCKEDKPA